MKQGERDSKKRIAFPIQLFGEGPSFAELPDEIHVVPTGKWQHPNYGEMEITSATVSEFVQNFKDMVRRDLPITAGHDNGMNGGELEAIGWFKELIDRGVNGLYAVVEWTEEGKRLLSNRAFKYFSPEFYEKYEDPETGDTREHVLVGGALTNRPYFKELDPVVAFSEPRIITKFNEHNNDMNLKDILAKKPEELSDAEKAFVREHKSELDADQTTVFESVLVETPSETDEEKTAREQKEKEDANEAAGLNRDGSAKVVASERGTKVITMSEAEVTALRTAADAGAKALQKIEASERAQKAARMVFSSSNKDGRFTPKQQPALESFMATLSEKQQDQLINLVNNMPKMQFGEIGDGGKENDGSAATIYSEIKGLADAKILASEGKLKFSQALLQVYAEKPELKASYEAALAAGDK
jgi:phage I-like protein